MRLGFLEARQSSATMASRTSQRARRPRKRPRTGADRYRIDAISNSARLLRVFSRSAPRLPVDALARTLGLSSELTERTILTLKKHGLIRPSDGAPGIYELGLSWLRLADVRRRQVGIRQAALPVMRRIRDALNETVILSI